MLVNKLSYDLHDVHRGDIVVFEAEPNAEWHRAGIDDLVKRVIALPGETVTQCDDRKICIDGKLLDESYLPEGVAPLEPVADRPAVHHRHERREGPRLRRGRAERQPARAAARCPRARYFVMGDNRSESSDARAHGPIKESSIVGRVFVRIWPPDRLGFL